MRALTLLEKIVVSMVILGLLAFAFGSSVATAEIPPQGSAPKDEAVAPEPSVYWTLFIRGEAVGGRVHPMVFVEEEGCRAVETKAAEDPTISESSGCVRIELKIKPTTIKEGPTS